MSIYFFFGLLGWALIQGWCLVEAEHLINVHLFQPHINQTKKKEHRFNFLLSIYEYLQFFFLFLEGGGVGSYCSVSLLFVG